MTADGLAPSNVLLRYGSAKVFDGPDTHSHELAELAKGDPFTVIGADGEYYQVQLPDGTTGFVYAHNLIGSNMPPTASEQETTIRREAEAARVASTWRARAGRWFSR